MALGPKSLTGHAPSGPLTKPTSSNRERLAWYWARTARMDAKEIAHRLVESATKQFSRRLTQGWDAIKPVGRLASLPGIAEGLHNCRSTVAAVLAREAEDVQAG